MGIVDYVNTVLCVLKLVLCVCPVYDKSKRKRKGVPIYMFLIVTPIAVLYQWFLCFRVGLVFITATVSFVGYGF